MPSPRPKMQRRKKVIRRAAPCRVKKSSRGLSASSVRVTASKLFDALPVVVFGYTYSTADAHGFTHVSGPTQKVLGLKPAELVKSAGALRLHPDDVDHFEERVLARMAAGEDVDAQLRIMHKANTSRWIHISAWPQPALAKKSAPNATRYAGLILDIDASKQADIEQFIMLERMEEAQEIAKMGWYDFNVKSRVLDLTSDFADSLGLPLAPSGRVSGADADQYIDAFLSALHPDDRERYMAIIADESWRRIEFDYRILTRSNEVRHLCSRIRRTTDKSGKRIRDFAVILDITERKRLEEDLRAQAGTDPLTDVPNRRSFEAAARREIERARRYAKPFAVIALDIDFFKNVNDTHGHDVGDVVLKELTKICLAQLRLTDVIARLGGEEFAVLLPETDIIAATKSAERLRVAVAATPITTPKIALSITISLGVAQHVPSEHSIGLALKRADEALYEAKNSGRNKVVVAKPPSAASTGRDS